LPVRKEEGGAILVLTVCYRNETTSNRIPKSERKKRFIFCRRGEGGGEKALIRAMGQAARKNQKWGC